MNRPKSVGYCKGTPGPALSLSEYACRFVGQVEYDLADYPQTFDEHKDAVIDGTPGSTSHISWRRGFSLGWIL
ncbi:MAG: hypothetical protein WA996_18375 [Candidatus Promineifilaceae bacterium]